MNNHVNSMAYVVNSRISHGSRPTLYWKDGRLVNDPAVVARVRESLPAPTECRFCGGQVSLVNNAQFYGGREYGWPLAYACGTCGARVGCHPGTDIPLGTLADRATMNARRAAHTVFDPLWQSKGKGARRKAYEALSRAMGKPSAHISWMDIADCREVIRIVTSGELGMSEANSYDLFHTGKTLI